MKFFLIAFFTAAISSARCQDPNPDPFEQRRSEFVNAHWTNVDSVDTVQNSKDSIIVTDKYKSGYARTTVQLKNDTGCVRESYTNFVDPKGLILYSEHWRYDCNKSDPNDWDGYLDRYKRYVYNNKGQLTAQYFDNYSITTKVAYTYDEKGNRQSRGSRIKHEDFWID